MVATVSDGHYCTMGTVISLSKHFRRLPVGKRRAKSGLAAATNVAVTWQRRYKAYRNANVNARQKRSNHLEIGAGNQQDAIDCRHLGLSSDGDCSVFKRDASNTKMMDSLIRAKGVISM